MEIRTYSPSKWVGISYKGQVKGVSSNQMFMSLFSYISGNNDQNKKIEMTSPVLTQIQNSNNELVNMNSNVEMSMIFYVPKSDQDNTPNPKGANEFVKNEVEMTVATIRFGGWASMPKYIAKRDELIKMLGEAAACLAFDVSRAEVAGGFWTPASALGEKLLVRLHSHAGLSFERQDD